ncbi:MAG: dephospho-CoA kinase [Candidatus Omnitrophica bacterium]|nr:dephospho-CoA kinase [Candidatus Omnitrophota bacterium]
MRPLLVGLTGGFASGKSTAARMFRKLGACVLDSDRIVREALQTGTATHRRIVRAFGPAVLRRDRALDRAKLAAVVFRDARARKRLEKIVHPFVLAQIRRRARESKRPVVVAEVPLLFEVGFDRHVDVSVVVKASRRRQLALAARRGTKKPDAERRIRAQWPLAGKLKRADFIIDNDGPLRKTEAEVKRVWTKITTKEV